MIIIAENRIWNNENRISKFEIEKTFNLEGSRSALNRFGSLLLLLNN